jgi:hypothetical protein
MFRYPVVVGGGTPFLPPATEDVPLDLIETRTFGSRWQERHATNARAAVLDPKRRPRVSKRHALPTHLGFGTDVRSSERRTRGHTVWSETAQSTARTVC